ncbi:MAG: UDP-3-O-(3-hydroxymyristoyl)glucosamine N-acyltransferase [Acidobacteriota bacterium]|nr:UDP-3-O-(3-hydroxymyristoyl)glucosamine N-acyltransferase [Acidobacteriota bacterium]
MTISDLIDELGGTLSNGDPTRTVDAVNSVEQAGPFDLVFAESSAAVELALNSGAGAVVLRPSAEQANPHDKLIIESDQPRLWFAKAAHLLAPRLLSTGVHSSAVVSQEATLAPAVTIGPCAVVGSHVQIGEETRVEAGAVIGEGVHIGAKCRIHPRVVVYPGVTIGNGVIVHAGAVLGADGFGYVRDNATGAHTQFPQQGTLVIEDDVEIGANTTIDRGALSETRIKRGTKIDNLVHVGHNCQIGEDVILVALTGISGSSKVGDQAVIAGQVGLGDHVTIGPGVILGGQSGVFNGKTLTNEGQKPGTIFFGTPARPLPQVLREQATLSRMARRRDKPANDSPDK